ncbi:MULTISPECIES: hypothetical protein [Myxococcus]|uniref:hypothetical protein n=1 Tax=Myxococcus TaxID=32 RepID=UPI001142C71D|nr:MULTISPECIES: hypothetical protein [Myxococcus]NOK01953.1 hypothetical protein [Myxococcus xanthus]
MKAWANNQFLLLYDESKVLSTTGKLRLSRTNPKVEFGWLPSTTASGDRTVVDAMTATVHYIAGFPNVTASTQSLSGAFRLSVAGALIEVDYALSKSVGAAVGECGAVNPCSSGMVCEDGLQVCVPGDAWSFVRQGSASSTVAPRNTIVHEQRKAWNDSGAQQLQEAPAFFGMSHAFLAQGIMCQSGDQQSPVRIFDDEILSYSGDLACLNGLPPSLSRLATQRDFNAVRPGLAVLDSRQMLQACIGDLQAMPQWPMSTDIQSFFQARLQNPGQCFSAVRLFDSLSLLGDRRRADHDRLRWYLLQRWIEANAFTARQVVQQQGSYSYLGDNPNWQVPSLASSLDQFERAWDLMFDEAVPQIGSYVGGNSFCDLKNPDYRLPPRPTGVWSWRSNSLVMDRWVAPDHFPGGSDLTVFWYPNASAQSSCDVIQADECAQNREGCPPGRCEKGFYPILSFGEEVGGEASNKFYVHKFGNEYMAGAEEVLIVEHVAGGEWTRVEHELEWMDPDITAPYVVRRRSGQYEVHSPYQQPFFVVPSSTGPTGFVAPYTEDPAAGDLKNSTSGAVVWDHALSDEQVAEFVQKSASHFADRSSDLLAPNGSLPHHDQGIGLPTVILEGLSAHLELLDAELERVSRTAACSDTSPGSERGQAMERFGRAFRYSIVLESRAAAQHYNVRSMNCDGTVGMGPNIEARWKKARAGLEAVRNRVQQRFAAMQSCRPWNIPEDEAPLFFRSATGASERYFASSDYILGYAASGLAQAEADVEAARTAWDQQRTSAIQQQLSEFDVQRRLETLKTEYGRPLVEMCGLDSEAKDALALFDPEQPNALRAETCYVARQSPECSVTPISLYSAVRAPAARYSLCVWNGLRGRGEITLPSPYFEVAAGWHEAVVLGGMVRARGQQMPVTALYRPPFSVDKVSEASLAYFEQQCSGSLGGIHMLPSPVDIDRSLGNECFRGELGRLRLEVTAASQSMQVARSSWVDAQERHDISTRRCWDVVEDGNARLALIDEHEKKMVRLISARSDADRLNQGVDSVNRAISMAGTGATLGASLGGPIGGGVGFVIGLGIGVLGGLKADESARISRQIAIAEQEFNTKLETLSLASSVKECFYNANLHMVGIKTAALQIERAATDVELALLNMRNMQDRVTQLSHEGAAAVSREEGRQVPSVAHHYWLDERIATAEASLQWARRLSYLLALSLESEMQQSLIERRQVLSASGPAELRAVFNRLNQLKFAGKVGGRFPGEVSVTLSLRDDVLKLVSQEDSPLGERAFSPEERFARRMAAPESAVFDRDGRYMGQGIRFAMPVPNGLALRCAERVWSVRALVTTGHLGNWVEANGVQVLLYKRNAFQSHWCDSLGRGDGSDFQVRASRPSLDLTGLGGQHNRASTAAWSAAGLQAKLNMEQADWVSLGCTIQTGCSDELAGRGFYGEYLLLVPYLGALENGFPVNKIADIHLRFDVVSISNAPEPSASPSNQDLLHDASRGSMCEPEDVGEASCLSF